MHRHARRRLGYIALADARGNVFSIEKDAMAADGALKSNVRILRHLQQRSFVVERSVALNRPQRQSAVHRPALQVDVAEFARQAGSDGALARSGGTVNGDDEFALGWIGHRGNVRFYTGHARKTTGPWCDGTLIVWRRAPSPGQAGRSSASFLPGRP